MSGSTAGRTGGGRLKGVSLVLGGAVLFAAGLFIVATGTGLSGLLGMRVETFGDIDCRDTRTSKGQTVWHCFGAADGVGPTRISFADHDGRNDPETITATQLTEGGRWFAHSSTIVGYGMIPLLLGTGVAAWGGYRVRDAGRPGR
ncbi:hypothetical protein GTY67_19315 [Streptomyces sp. SID8374]|uniref:hypothetical protein n=1 Tax=Streptomyces sp. SID8374 TaxID=2690354 RepID=UPI00136FA1F6|nr:hypothetical protein [Streptomyces sp. SID8374]MYX15512.1 hypothetical protein [Streptomyces sp. SID8374]